MLFKKQKTQILILPSILLRSVFSRSGLSCASRRRSSLVQIMKAFRGLLTLCCAAADLGSGLVQLESEFAESGLEGPELGEHTWAIWSPSAIGNSSLHETELQNWKSAGSWPKYMFADGSVAGCHPPDDEELYMWALLQWEARRSGFKVWIPGVFSGLWPGDPINDFTKLQIGVRVESVYTPQFF